MGHDDKMISIQRPCFTVALGGLTAWGSAALAQSAAPQDGASGVALEEVVVTALRELRMVKALRLWL